MTTEEKAKEYADTNYHKTGMNDDWVRYNASGNNIAEKAFLAGVKEATRWIPVGESLPEVDKDVLLKGYWENESDIRYGIGYLHTGKDHNFITSDLLVVTQWRPIEFEIM